MKSVKNLLVPFIILIALIIGVVVYYAVNNAKNKKPVETSGGLIDVVYVNRSDISSVSVFNRETGNTATVTCTANSNGSYVYEYLGDDAVPGEEYSQSGLSNFVDYMTYFACNSKVSSSGNFSDYGLDTPRFTITINANNGTSTTVYLGNRSPDGKYCYMFVEGSADIYTIGVIKLAYAEKTAVNFIDTKALNINYNDLKTVHFDRKTDGLSLDANVSVSNNIATFEFYKPYVHEASPYFGTLMDSITSLQISEYIDVDASGLAAYGLDDPCYHFVLTMNNGEKTELYFSKKISGFYYGYMTGLNKYFMLSEYQIDGLDMQELVLIDPSSAIISRRISHRSQELITASLLSSNWTFLKASRSHLHLQLSALTDVMQRYPIHSADHIVRSFMKALRASISAVSKRSPRQIRLRLLY